MSERVYSFLVVLLLIFSGEIFGQNGVSQISPVASFSATYKKNTNVKGYPVLISHRIIEADKKNEKYFSLRSNFFVIEAPFQIKTISPSFYKDELGFMCKKEWQLEKITTVPFRFRLGSLDYVNYLEKKPNAIKPANN